MTVAGFTVRLVSVCAITFPLPADAPEILPGGAMAMVQENVVDGVALESTIFVVPKEQIV